MSFQLTPAQQAAVEYVDGTSLICAGAGSGKTSVLTAKVQHLVQKLQTPPDRILAITFTNKAANEMIDRIQRTSVEFLEFPWVRTFHSACCRILLDNVAKLGYSHGISIFDKSKQKRAFLDTLKSANLDKELYKEVSTLNSFAKNSGDFEAYMDNQVMEGKTSVQKVEVCKAYNDFLYKNNALDFDDILLLTNRLLNQDEDSREYFRDLFKYVLVDEFQDTNTVQLQILQKLVRPDNLTVVGDDFQAIYSFRGASFENFVNFEKFFPGAKIFKLEQNFRCSDEIVSLANKMILANTNQIPKTCFSTKRGGKIKTLKYADEYEEADAVANAVLQMAKAGMDYSRAAILCRTKYSSRVFEQAFRKRNIPYELVGQSSFFERREIVDLMSYLQVAVNPKDDLACKRALGAPKRGVGPMLFAKLSEDFPGMSVYESIVAHVSIAKKTGKIAASLSDFVKLIKEIQSFSVTDALGHIIESVDYLTYMEKFSVDEKDFESRDENLVELLHYSTMFDSMEKFVIENSLLTKEEKKQQSKHAVTISTVHAAKGMEYEVVFVAGLVNGNFPHYNSMDEDTEEYDEEENRLMYVAMTRAERLLYLTYSKTRQGKDCVPSHFFDHLDINVRKKPYGKKQERGALVGMPIL